MTCEMMTWDVCKFVCVCCVYLYVSWLHGHPCVLHLDLKLENVFFGPLLSGVYVCECVNFSLLSPYTSALESIYQVPHAACMEYVCVFALYVCGCVGVCTRCLMQHIAHRCFFAFALSFSSLFMCDVCNAEITDFSLRMEMGLWGIMKHICTHDNTHATHAHMMTHMQW